MNKIIKHNKIGFLAIALILSSFSAVISQNNTLQKPDPYLTRGHEDDLGGWRIIHCDGTGDIWCIVG